MNLKWRIEETEPDNKEKCYLVLLNANLEDPKKQRILMDRYHADLLMTSHNNDIEAAFQVGRALGG